MGEGEGGMVWENSIETCIIPYVKQIASPGSMYDTGCSGLVHWDDPEGWYVPKLSLLINLSLKAQGPNDYGLKYNLDAVFHDYES